jgi:hypothetical protein
MGDEALARLVDELRRVAAACFSEIPEYQALTGARDELSDKVITLARDRRDGRLLGFCSAVLLEVPRMRPVLHLGLTCVHPDARSGGLTHKLTSRLVVRYLVRRRPLGRLWVSNVACVLSSLGNVARNFEDVYPAPGGRSLPTAKHLRVAHAIDASYRDKIAINPDAVLDPRAFVFRGSVRGTPFQKRADDARYFHREDTLNDFYRDLMRFDDGDETVQVGRVSLFTGFRYGLRRLAASHALRGLGKRLRAGLRRPSEQVA